MGSGEDEFEQTRAFFADHGLLPRIPDRYADDEGEIERARVRILAPVRPAVHSRNWGHRALLAAAVVAVVAIGWGAQVVFRSAPAAAAGAPTMLRYSIAGPGSVASAPSAADVLLTAARHAAALSPAEHVGDVQYVARYGWLSSGRGDGDKTIAFEVNPTLTQWWLTPDGGVRLDESRLAPLDLNGQLTDEAPTAPARDTSDTGAPGTFDPGLAERLPTGSVTALRAALIATQAGLPCGQDAWWQAHCLVHAVQDTYDRYVVSPVLASAMWRVLAGVGDVHSLGTTTDRLGRPAIAVALPPEPGEPSQEVAVLLVAADTGAYLGNETVMLRDASMGIDKPTVVSFNELTATRWVAAPGSTS